MYLVNRKLKSIYSILLAFMSIACTDCYAMENENDDNYKNLAVDFYEKVIQLNPVNKYSETEVFKKSFINTIIMQNELCLGGTRHNIIQIPNEIGNLTKLNRIELEENSLTQIPQNLWQIKTLTYLNLSDNRLTNLPPEIGNMQSLKRLYLKGDNNHFKPEACNDNFEGIELQHFLSAQRRILSTKQALFNQYILIHSFVMEHFGFEDIGHYIRLNLCSLHSNDDAILNAPSEELKYLI